MELVKGVLSEKYHLYRGTAAVLGSAFLGFLMLKALRNLYSVFRAYFLAPLGIGRTNLLNYGKWAVITGASDGIGRAYALELARCGLNTVLISRSKDKLDRVAKEIKEKFDRESLVISVDFCDDFDVYSYIQKQLKDLDIGILVNNVGVYYAYPDATCNIPAKKLYSMVQVNCHSVVQMTHILLPQMIRRKRGIIVNISSSAGIRPAAGIAVYSATKVFVDYFSEGLRKEYSNKGIIVQNIAPAVVSTNMNNHLPMTAGVMEVSAFVRAAVATIGIQDYSHGCLTHAVVCNIFRRLPDFLSDAIFADFNKKLKVHVIKQKKEEEME